VINALIARFLFSNGSFWDILIFNITNFDNYYRISTLVIFFIYGIVASKIIRRRRHWGENLLKSKAKMRTLMGAIPDSLLRVRSDGTLLESVNEDSPTDRFAPFLAENVDIIWPPDIAKRITHCINSALTTGDIQIFDYHENQSGVDCYFEARIVKTGEDEVLVILRDVTESKTLEERLRTLSLTDDLTGLSNRRGFFHLAGQMMKLAGRTKKAMLLFYADLDDLKQINDSFGHREGDAALVDAGIIMRDTFRLSDVIARMGGDEFAALMIEIQGPGVENIIIERFERNLRDMNARKKREYKLSMSVGIARYDPNNPSSIDELLARADDSMYQYKKEAKERAVAHRFPKEVPFEKPDLKAANSAERGNRSGDG
jgi:diguanylate cyclase (GGDEF)-like protein